MAPGKKKTPRWTNKKHAPSKKTQRRKLSIEELIQAAENAMTISDPAHAVTLYTAALQKAADNTQQQLDVLEKRAEVYVSLHNQEAAMQDYQTALSLIPEQQQTVDDLERRAAVNLYIGQLASENEALAAYRNGIDCLKSAISIIEKDLQQTQPAVAVAVTDTSDTDVMVREEGSPLSTGVSSLPEQLAHCKRQLATTYCSAAELYLTDLCYEDNAESQCETYLQDALKLVDDDNNIDALQTMANLRLSQNRGAEAVSFMLRVYAAMETGCEALASLVGLRENTGNTVGATELQELQEVQNLPGFEFRCQSAKLLLECANLSHERREDNDDQKEQCAQAAINVLGSLLAENDEVVEVWTLVGDAFAVLDANDDEKLHYWERALEMLTAVQESLQQVQQNDLSQEEEDEIQQQLDEVICQMEDLRSKLQQSRREEDDAMEE